MKWTRPETKAIAVAILVALAVPLTWYALFVEVRKTPPITREESERMSSSERMEWMERNERPLSLGEKLMETPKFMQRHWPSMLSASVSVFGLMFVVAGFSRRKR